MAVTVEDLREAHARGTLRGIIRAGEDLLGRAQRLAPVEEGTLRASASLTIIVNGRRFEGGIGAQRMAESLVVMLARRGALKSIDAEVSFNTVYAARQHEETSWDHPLGGQAKYLEQPLRENVRRYSRAIALEGEAALRRARS
jgi:hypothetical protein